MKCVGVPLGIGVCDGVGLGAGVRDGFLLVVESVSGMAGGGDSVVNEVLTAPPCGLPHTFLTEA